MIVDLDQPSRAAELDLREWSAAEFLDIRFSDDLVLRAVVCRLAAGQWHWSVISLDGERGELISAGVENSATSARRMVTDEIAKCFESPID